MSQNNMDDFLEKKQEYEIEESRRNKLKNVTDYKTRIKREYINIDSRSREMEPSLKMEDIIELNKNPISFDGDFLWIKVPKDKSSIFNSGDLITLEGIEKTVKSLKTYISDTDKFFLKFTEGDKYLKIEGINPLFNVVPSRKALKRCTVTISGNSNFSNRNYIGNIPINLIFDTHPIILKHPEDSTETTVDPNNPNGFYIELPREFSGEFNKLGNIITLTFNHYGSIPVSIINAKYPIDSNSAKGNHIIAKKSNNFIGVKLPFKSYYNNINFGGNNIILSKIETFDPGFPDPNNYQINLGKSYNNVISASIISSNFPNTAKVFKSNPPQRKNNKLYWQNAEDGDTIYEVEIPEGNYTPDSLKNTLEEEINKIDREVINDVYDDKNLFEVNFDLNTNVVKFKSFRKASLRSPIINVSPKITNQTHIFNLSQVYLLTISHPSHELNVGDTILIRNAVSHNGIPFDVINQEHQISEVIDQDKYNIQIKNFNLQTNREETNGGNRFTVLAPSSFRLFFNYSDTMGKELGFRKVGEDIAVSKFSTEVSNFELYQNELEKDSLGNPIDIHPNFLRFSGDDFLFVICKELGNIKNTQNIDNIFDKINLTSLPGRIVFNEHLGFKNTFNKYLNNVNKLTFEFRDPFNNLFDFNGIDHSFVILIEYCDRFFEND